MVFIHACGSIVGVFYSKDLPQRDRFVRTYLHNYTRTGSSLSWRSASVTKVTTSLGWLVAQMLVLWIFSYAYIIQRYACTLVLQKTPGIPRRLTSFVWWHRNCVTDEISFRAFRHFCHEYFWNQNKQLMRLVAINLHMAAARQLRSYLKK